MIIKMAFENNLYLSKLWEEKYGKDDNNKTKQKNANSNLEIRDILINKSIRKNKKRN